MIKLFFAPLQGYTETAYRRAHQAVYGPEGAPDAYFMPFSRVEKGRVRTKDIRELIESKELSDNIPQAIFNSKEELQQILQEFFKAGFVNVDLNCGCPFPPQVKHGRGTGVLCGTTLTDIRDLLESYHALGMHFSIKMRLGINKPDEWRESVDAINQLPLDFITVHPRTAIQQYGGELFVDQVDAVINELAFPLVLNGDICTIEDVKVAIERWPNLYGVMLGRGALSRPSVFAEIRSGEAMTDSLRHQKLSKLYSLVESDMISRLCGDNQILSKTKPFWDYLECEIGHKTAKAIRKAGTYDKYRRALPDWI